MGFGKDGKGVIGYDSIEVTLGAALVARGANDFLTIGMDEDFRLIKIEGAVLVAGLANDEMAAVVLYDVELSDSELADVMSASPSDRNDHATNEKAMRPVFILGYAGGPQSEGNCLVKFERTIRWTFSSPEGFALGVMNPASVNAHAGALTLTSLIKYYGVWVT